MVQRCNGNTAGLGYLEALELSMQILLLGHLASVRTANSQWGRRIQFLYERKPLIKNIINTAPMHPSCKPTFGSQNHKKANPNRYIVLYLLINLHIVPINEINIQKDWHWPQNILKSKKRRYTEING